MTHNELCHVAAKWVRKRHRCSVVLVDVKTMNTSEQPDVLAWQNYGYSVLVEVKVNVQDFVRDYKKPFRRDPARGMGCERWFAMPKGLWDNVPQHHRCLNPTAMGRFTSKQPPRSTDADARWGLIEFDDKGKSLILHKPTAYKTYNVQAEKRLLITSVRRVTEGWGRGMFDNVDPEVKASGDRHPQYHVRELQNTLNRVQQQHQRILRGLNLDLDTVRGERDALRKQLDDLSNRLALHSVTVPATEY